MLVLSGNMIGETFLLGISFSVFKKNYKEKEMSEKIYLNLFKINKYIFLSSSFNHPLTAQMHLLFITDCPQIGKHC